MKFLQVEIYRADILESRHRVMACLVDAAGQVVDQWGAQNDLAQPVFPRSAIKPLQALHFLESGAWQAFDLSDQHLVFSASSHEGENFHLQLAQDWMKKLGFQQSDLCCGGHWPTNVASQHELIRQGKKPEATWNNCSGKHLGILSTCRHLRMDIANYGAWEHPIQVDLRNRLSLWLDCDLHQAPWGIDGCGIPTMAFPLQNLAKGMAHLLTGSNIAAGRRNIAVATLIAAIQKYPEYLGGTMDFSSRVTAASEGQALIKTGAEGVFAGVLFEKKQAFALKALDGQTRASQAAVHFLLNRWGVAGIEGLGPSEIRNWNNEVVGSVRVCEKRL